VLVEVGEVTHELAEVAGVGAVLGAVLTPEVEELVQWDGSEVEGYLLEVDGDDVSCGGQGAQAECVDQCSEWADSGRSLDPPQPGATPCRPGLSRCSSPWVSEQRPVAHVVGDEQRDPVEEQQEALDPMALVGAQYGSWR